MSTNATVLETTRSSRASWFLWRSMGYLLLLMLTVLCLFPLVWLVTTSLRPQKEVFGSGLIPQSISLDAYRFIFERLDIAQYFLNSVKITGITVVSVVFLATLSGYSFAKLSFPGKGVIFITLLSTLMLPSTVLVIPQFLQLSDMGLINSHTGLILAYIGGALAFSMFLMRSFFETLPNDLADAARVDGESEFGVFARIMLPLARPGVATITIFQFMSTWNEFISAATFLHDPEIRTLQPMLFSLMGRYATNWPALTAGLAISIIPIVTIYVFMQRQFVSGLTAGALKG